MSFTKNLSNGASILWNSLFLPLSVPQVFGYAFLTMAISAVGQAYQISQVTSWFAVAYNVILATFIGLFGGVFALAGITRSVINYFNGEHRPFFENMYLSSYQIFMYLMVCFLSSVFNQTMIFAMKTQQLTLLFAALLANVIFIALAYIAPIIFMNPGSLGEMVKESAVYVKRTFEELITAFILLMALIIGLVISFVLMLRFGLVEFGLNVSFISLALFYSILVIFMTCGLATFIPTMYWYITNNKRNPFTSD